MARSSRLTEHEPGQEPSQPAGTDSTGTDLTGTDLSGAPRAQRPATRIPREIKPPSQLWGDGLGRVGIRSAQILLILTVAVVSVYALMQIKLLVIPILIALILAAAIGPFVNMLRRRGMRGGLATGIAFIGLLLVLGGVGTVIYFSVRSQWASLPSRPRQAWTSWSSSC